MNPLAETQKKFPASASLRLLRCAHSSIRYLRFFAAFLAGFLAAFLAGFLAAFLAGFLAGFFGAAFLRAAFFFAMAVLFWLRAC